MIRCLNFLRNKNYVHKISSKNITFKFQIKIYLESFIYLPFVSFIWNYLQIVFYNLNITSLELKSVISKTINIRGNFIWKCLLGTSIPVVWHSFLFFSVITIFKIISCIFILKLFRCYNSSVSPFVFALSLQRRYIYMGKLWSNE